MPACTNVTCTSLMLWLRFNLMPSGAGLKLMRAKHLEETGAK